MRRTLVRLAAGVLLLAALVAGPAAYGQLTASGRVDPALERTDGPVSVRVLMSFKPQTFQRQQLSRYGVFGGIEGNAVRLFNVTPWGLGQLRGLYWIDRIEPFRR
jgi:hypothetical protein